MMQVLDGLGFDLGGLKTSFLAGRWFSIAFDFLGAGVGVGGARISLHLETFTLTKTHTTAALPL